MQKQARAVLPPFVVFLALFAAPSVAAAAGDPQRGRELAEQWCSSCHLVSAEQQTASTDAPPFETIADRSPDEFSWLEAFLADPHPPMPQLSLSRDEIRDLVAYIASLREN
jgi:mono/diheme cytochrome c family protein